MGKKYALLGLALLALVASHLRPVCRVSVNGQALEGLYTPQAVDRAVEAAAWTAEEILQGPATLPEIRRAYRLRFRREEGDGPALTDAVLRSVTGVKLADLVYVNGTRLGIVEDGAELRRRLVHFIDAQMPNAAVSGVISGKLEILRRYSRSNCAVNYEDMVLLVTGMAPVVYTDENGKLA